MGARRKSKRPSTVANITGDISSHVHRAEIREAVRRYVAARVGRECEEEKGKGGRGLQAAIGKATGTSRAHVSSVASGTSGVSIEFAEKMAPFWGMTVEELEREAVERADENPRSKVISGQTRRLRDRAEWGSAAEAARAFYDDIPEELFDRVGAIFDDVTGPVDAAFVADMAKILRELEHRRTLKLHDGMPPSTFLRMQKTKK